MLARLLAACGYRKPDDLSDFMMTGVAVLPIVAFFACGIGEAIMVMLLCLVPALMAFPWLHARDEIRRHEAEARAAYLRQITGREH
jgi:hypothetical protein